MSKLLINDQPVMVLPKLAEAIGLNEAIVLQQIHYWLTTYQEADKEDHYRDGKWWVYNTKAEWQENFPWWSESTVWRTLTALRESELVRTTDTYNKKGYDRTLWYTINYKTLAELEKSILSKWENASSQNDKMENVNMTSPIPETTTETTTDLTDTLAGSDDDTETPDDALAGLMAQGTLPLPETKRLLAAWDAGTLIGGNKINPTAVLGKLFEHRFGSAANYSRLAGLVRQARDYRDPTDEITLEDWYTIAQAIDGSARPSGNVYDYIAGRFKDRMTDEDGEARTRYWCLVFDRGERIEPGRLREDPPGRATEGSTPSRKVLEEHGSIVKAWWLCERNDTGDWIEVEE